MLATISQRNIFREALMLLNTKNGQGMSDEEREIVATATLPLMLLPEYSDIPIHEGLEDLARMLEEEKMICMFTHEPCKYVNCPLWNERLQACRFILAIDKVLSEKKPLIQLTPKESEMKASVGQG